ncbi:LAME_0F05468g1_1 [Lachancea meyersii CBS 8951]|uniref:LAME_0F05468g1_1 n=1 Tax=Lachancea meyersii CBS 8951 TaxID=1266667 RepID=A0A1G4JST6_9SACH|nr:LAME_0F05468g1_1 [Lachancea meyersii CBS 8951]
MKPVVGSQLSQLFDSLMTGNFACLSVNLNQNGRFVAELQAELQNIRTDKELEAMVENQKFEKGKWTRFNILVVSYLKFCQNVNPWSVWESSDLIFNYYQDLTNCLLNDSFPVDPLVTLFQDTTEYVIPLARELDSNYRELGTRQHQFLAHVSSVITKLFNSIKPRYEEPALRFDELPRKQQILLYTANRLNSIYMQIDSPASCANIFKNVKPKSAIQNFSQYPGRERIEYRYLLGRYYMLNHRVSNAFHQLNSAFALLIKCSAQTAGNAAVQRNKQRILRYLLPAGILFGKMPTPEICQLHGREMAQKYLALSHIVKSGSLHRFHVWLAQNEHELRRKGLLLVLLEKCPLLIYRSLIRRVIIDFCFPSDTNKISYSFLANGVQFSLGSLQGLKPIYSAIHAPENVANVLESLVNLGLFKANCFPLSEQCVFPKTDKIDYIFPSVNERLVAFFPLNSDDFWLDN